MRRTRGLLWLSMCLTIIFIVLNTRSSMELFESASIADKRNSLGRREESSVDDRWINRSQMHRYVTPSLAELGARGHLPYMYEHILMLTRIPGTGAELIVLILQRLQGYNAFKHIRLPSGDHGFLSTLRQEILVEEITSIIKQEAIPLSFDGNVRFLNFSEFSRQGPTFLSLVRDPLDPRIWQRERNSTWALERAKENVIRWYPVVGVLDYMEESLNALAIEFPYFFKGAIRIYNQLQLKYPPTHSVTSKLRIKDASLKKVLAQEVEFYEWLKSRLLNKISNND